MSILGTAININDLPDSNNNFDPIPAGDYNVTISAADVKETKAGNGEMIILTMNVLGPTHMGRVLFANINIVNPSEQAEQIGRSQLKAIMQAINLQNLADTSQLVGGNLSVKVAIKDDQQYGKTNSIKAFKPISGAVKQQAPVMQQPARQEARAPWAQ